METYNLAAITRLLYDAPISLFTTKTLLDLISPITRPSTFYSLLKRLQVNGVLIKLERDKYMLAGRLAHDFVLANFLYDPSYVSLETALNYYGILPQFPYEITSITPKKPAEKTVLGKTFRYAHIQQPLYWGFVPVQGYLVAEPEKALLDLEYLQKKGIRTLHLDDYDMSVLDKNRLAEYKRMFAETSGALC